VPKPVDSWRVAHDDEFSTLTCPEANIIIGSSNRGYVLADYAKADSSIPQAYPPDSLKMTRGGSLVRTPSFGRRMVQRQSRCRTCKKTIRELANRSAIYLACSVSRPIGHSSDTIAREALVNSAVGFSRMQEAFQFSSHSWRNLASLRTTVRTDTFNSFAISSLV
jgi:hypothetical protein